MAEKDIERRLAHAVKTELHGWALKLVSPGVAGVPDRLVLLPGGRAVFVELKDTGERPRPLQRHIQGRLRKLGFPVWVVDSAEGVRKFIDAEGRMEDEVSAARLPGAMH